jgi:hypothetical protein
MLSILDTSSAFPPSICDSMPRHWEIGGDWIRPTWSTFPKPSLGSSCVSVCLHRFLRTNDLPGSNPTQRRHPQPANSDQRAWHIAPKLVVVRAWHASTSQLTLGRSPGLGWPSVAAARTYRLSSASANTGRQRGERWTGVTGNVRRQPGERGTSVPRCKRHQRTPGRTPTSAVTHNRPTSAKERGTSRSNWSSFERGTLPPAS